jgi:hypothetical protein
VEVWGRSRLGHIWIWTDRDATSLAEPGSRDILTTLANDPGILACMNLHKWKVGSLAEPYPEGKVGESAVCVMGLNKNKGQICC